MRQHCSEEGAAAASSGRVILRMDSKMARTGHVTGPGRLRADRRYVRIPRLAAWATAAARDETLSFAKMLAMWR